MASLDAEAEAARAGKGASLTMDRQIVDDDEQLALGLADQAL